MEASLFFSIIVPVYRTEKRLLAQCFQSIQNQTYKNFECLIIDDGNEEDYAVYLDSFSDWDHRFRVLHIEHRGNSYGRNVGIDEATGDYLMFVDADDMIYPYVLWEAYRIIADHYPDMVIGLIKSYTNIEETSIENKSLTKFEYKLLRNKEEIEGYINHILGYRMNEFSFDDGYISDGPVAKVCRTSLAKDSKFPEGDIISEDVVWNMTISKTVASMVITSNVWYAYLHYLGSKSRRFYPDGKEQFIKQVDAYWNACKKNWPDCSRGLYIELWQEIAMFFRIYLNHPENQESWLSRYLIFIEIFQMPEYKEMLAKIDFSFECRKGMRIAKEITLFFMKHHIYLPAWIIWKKVSDEHLYI